MSGYRLRPKALADLAAIGDFIAAWRAAAPAAGLEARNRLDPAIPMAGRAGATRDLPRP